MPSLSPTITTHFNYAYNVKCNSIGYSTSYNISLYECVYQCNFENNCKLVNHYDYFDGNSDSRCILYNTYMCDMSNETVTSKSVIAYKQPNNILCESYPLTWVDNTQDSCNSTYYTDLNTCDNGRPNIGKRSDILLYGKNSISAMDVCCQCGGGSYYFEDIQLKFFNQYSFNRYNSFPLNVPNIDKQLKYWDNFILFDITTYNNVDKTQHFNELLLNDNIYICDLNINEMDEIPYYFILIKQNNNIYINNKWTNINESFGNNIHFISYVACTIQINTESNLIGFTSVNMPSLFPRTTNIPETNSLESKINIKTFISKNLDMGLIIIAGILGFISLCLFLCILYWYVSYIDILQYT